MATDTTLTYKRGDDIVWNLTFKNASGVAIDVHGCTIWFTAKESLSDLDAAAVIQQEYTLGAGEGLTGSYTFHVPKSKNITVGNFEYDFQFLSLATGYITTLGSGKIKILQDVTLDYTP